MFNSFFNNSCSKKKPRLYHLSILFLFFLFALVFSSCQQKEPVEEKHNKEKATNNPGQIVISAEKQKTPGKYLISSPHPNYKTSKTVPPYQYRGDIRRTGRYEYSSPENPGILLKFKADGKIRASAAVLPDGGVVFGTLEGSLYILNTDGSLRKHIKTDSWIYSTPVADSDGTIYAPCDNGDILALTPDGEKKWKFSLRAETSSSPLIFENNLYLGAEDNALHALTTKGSELWNFKTQKRVLFSSPSVDDEKNVYIGAEDGILYRVSPEGKAGWQFKTGDEISVCSPVIGDEGVVYIISSDGNIYAINKDGSLKWKYKPHEEIFGSPALGKDGTLYAAALDGVVMAFSPDGKLLWKVKAAKNIKSSPLIDRDNNLVIAGRDEVLSLDSQGITRWEIKKIDGKFSADPVLSYNGRILIGGEDGFFYVLGDSTGGSP